MNKSESSSGDFKDFYQYNADLNEWYSKASVPKKERSYAFSFVINGKGYVGGGAIGGVPVQDFYEYDPITGTWSEKNDLKDDKVDADANDKGYTIAREQAVSFVIGGKAYVVGGIRLGGPNSENWEYTPDSDTWEKKNAYEGGTVVGAVGFSIGDFGFVGTGSNGSSLNDKWRFDPTQIDIN